MAAVLDTNVLVSALMSPDGLCGQILALVFEGVVEPCVDARILSEYEEVLPRPSFGFDPDNVEGTLQTIYTVAEAITPRPLTVHLPHADGLPFLETAHEAHTALVTGNLWHFPPRQRAGVKVVAPRKFLGLLAQSQ